VSSFIEKVIAEADAELHRINVDLDAIGDGMNRAIAVLEELQQRQAGLQAEHAEVIRVLAAMKGEGSDPPEAVHVPVVDRATGEEVPDEPARDTTTPVELGTVESVTPVEPEGAEPTSADEARAASEPSSNGHSHTEELEFSRNGRKTPQRVSLEQVRDWVVGRPERFGTAEVAEALGISRGTAKKYIDKLVTHTPPLVEQHGTVGRYVRYSYIPPQKGTGPTHRPRSEPEVMAKAGVRRGGSRGRRDRAVAGTGKMIGRSGKPGLDKKRAEQGKRVKRGRVGS
jgi:hypothetical protein